jgi:hypothetical protein
VLLVALACSCAIGHAAEATPAAPSGAAFPIRVAQGQRCPVDRNGKPFLVHGDAAWSLVAQLTRDDAEAYLRDRQARGFNALLVNLIEHEQARYAPRNAYGYPPFDAPAGFAHPNDKYFSHFDWLLRRAEALGFIVLLAPAYLGYRGGDSGWYRKMQNAGTKRLSAYGRYLGKRYGNAPNVVWVHGGDYDPPDFTGVLALMQGLREVAPRSLHTFHGGRGSLSHATFPLASMLSLNTVYTDEDGVVEAARAASARSTVPFIHIEGRYEDMGASEAVVRAQAYQAVLAGACGHVMGHKHVWPFDPAWRSSLDSPGARSMTRMRNLLESLDWPNLRPAATDFLVEGEGTGRERAAAAVSADGRRAVAYIPSERALALDGSSLRGPLLTLQWIDPAGGPKQVEHPVDTVVPSPRMALRPPGRNSSGYTDWLLVLASTR